MTTSGAEAWRWIWRKHGVMDDVGWLSLDLEDQGGPPIDEEPWVAIRLAIYALARDVYDMVVSLVDGRVVLTGSVTSERTKAKLGDILARSAHDVRNDLEVASPFESAAGDKASLQPSATTVPGGPAGSVTRYPSIVPFKEARPGETFRFEVDLGCMPNPETEGAEIELSKLPPDWVEVKVDVEVFCDRISFEDESNSHAVITVFPDGSSAKAVFEGRIRVDAVAGTSFKLKVVFWQQGRVAGSAARSIPIESGIAVPNDGRESGDPLRPGSSLQIKAQVAPPKLNILIIGNNDPRRWTWRLDTPRDGNVFTTTSWREEIDLGADTREFARKLLKTCPDLRPGAKHVSVLRGIGEQIWGVTPTCFKKLYAELRGIHGPRFPIQITTDEPHVPWEMMFPDDASGIADADHLFMSHPIARWFGGEEGSMRDAFKSGGIVSFVPDYKAGGNLPAAKEEGRRLQDEFQAAAGNATYKGFTEFLRDPLTPSTVSVLHFAGHAAAPDEDVDGPEDGLRMSDGWVSATELHGGVALGRRDGTFVILNACSAGVAAEALGVVGGWPAGLAKRKFGGVLAPVWAVQDELASSVVLDQLKGLVVDGKMLGETLRDARVTYRNGSATPFAYLCYGDVMARMA